MVTIENEKDCVELEHRKGDDLLHTFEFNNEDDSGFDLGSVSLRWDIFKDQLPIISISGADLEISGSQVTFRKHRSFFDMLPVMGRYWHKLYDSITNTTLFEGPVVLIPSPLITQPGAIFFGATDATPVDNNTANDLPSIVSASTPSITLLTGMTLTKFVVVIPASMQIASVVDLSASNVDITDSYTEVSAIQITDQQGNITTYSVYEMNLGVPYSTDHSHLITFE